MNKDKEVVFPDLPNAKYGEVVTRFPPEASGYMHLGHIKALLINYHYAEKYNGKMILRFDDTNPDKESVLFEQAIAADIMTLGLGTELNNWTYSSDYFDKCLDCAYDLIKGGLAYMDFSKDEEINRQRSTLQPSPYRISLQLLNESITKNLAEFDALLQGTRTDGCLRAAIDYKSLNGCMRDPVIYRYKDSNHIRLGGDKNKIRAYPTYDFSCPIVDALQGVTHALRSIEYADRDDQYNWFLDKLNVSQLKNKPVIMSYRKLNFAYTVLSKRKLARLVQEKVVDGWDDPRMPTVRGALKAGIRIDPLLAYIRTQLFGSCIVNLDPCKLWAYNITYLDKVSKRLYAISDPIPIQLTSADTLPTQIELKNHPKDTSLGVRVLTITDKLLVDKEDFIGVQVGHRYTLVGIGNAVVTCLDPLTLNYDPNDKDFKSTLKLTWLPLADNIPVTVRKYGRLLNEAKLGDADIVKAFNKKSLDTQTWLFEPSILDMHKGDVFQVMRKDYCYVDKSILDKDSSEIIVNIVLK